MAKPILAVKSQGSRDLRRLLYGSMRRIALSLLALSMALVSAPIEAKTKKTALPAMRWDAAPSAANWTQNALLKVADHDDELSSTVPADIEVYCPGYETASHDERRAFWVGLLSATAKYESGFNPKAVGGNGRYVGLMQISLPTAKHYGCEATSAADLKDGTANLSCAVDIIAPHVARDGMVAGKGNRGIARDWGPWSSAKNRAAMAAWTSRQSYCQP
ncbi:MAG: transglycosylase SLT domain-containing protein [Cypionkella sp.]